MVYGNFSKFLHFLPSIQQRLSLQDIWMRLATINSKLLKQILVYQNVQVKLIFKIIIIIDIYIAHIAEASRRLETEGVEMT